MNVLIVCNWGKNRSGYLAEYLKQKGYSVQNGGIYKESDNPVSSEMVDWSEVIIFVQPQTKEDFEKLFRISGQKIIILDVEDRLSILVPNNQKMIPEEWVKLQQEKVYPELERQINKHLPL